MAWNAMQSVVGSLKGSFSAAQVARLSNLTACRPGPHIAILHLCSSWALVAAPPPASAKHSCGAVSRGALPR